MWYSEGEPVFDENFEPTFADGGVAFQKVIEMHKQWLDEGITPPDIMTHELESTAAWMTGNHSFMVVHDYDQHAFNLGKDSEHQRHGRQRDHARQLPATPSDGPPAT